jgi:SAM-dependent methyltransferase
MTDPKPFVFDETGEAKRYAPATQRNRDAIADVLRDVLPKQGTVLEIASGTGEHMVHFAARFPNLDWQPSDYDAAGLESIAAWSAEAALPNIAPPVQIDASVPDWPVTTADAILCINMIHIAPWTAAEGLMAGAGQVLPNGGVLYLYGPYREQAVPTATSNEDFDVSLKSRNLAWGLRSVEDVVALAATHGIAFEARISMPANNLSLVFRKT